MEVLWVMEFSGRVTWSTTSKKTVVLCLPFPLTGGPATRIVNFVPVRLPGQEIPDAFFSVMQIWGPQGCNNYITLI